LDLAFRIQQASLPRIATKAAPWRTALSNYDIWNPNVPSPLRDHRLRFIEYPARYRERDRGADRARNRVDHPLVDGSQALPHCAKSPPSTNDSVPGSRSTMGRSNDTPAAWSRPGGFLLSNVRHASGRAPSRPAPREAPEIGLLPDAALRQAASRPLQTCPRRNRNCEIRALLTRGTRHELNFRSIEITLTSGPNAFRFAHFDREVERLPRRTIRSAVFTNPFRRMPERRVVCAARGHSITQPRTRPLLEAAEQRPAPCCEDRVVPARMDRSFAAPTAASTASQPHQPPRSQIFFFWKF